MKTRHLALFTNMLLRLIDAFPVSLAKVALGAIGYYSADFVKCMESNVYLNGRETFDSFQIWSIKHY